MLKSEQNQKQIVLTSYVYLSKDRQIERTVRSEVYFNKLSDQEIKEYFSADEWGNAYLLTVDRPKQDTALPYHVFKVELEDLDNGDRGEGIYYMEKEQYVTGKDS